MDSIPVALFVIFVGVVALLVLLIALGLAIGFGRAHSRDAQNTVIETVKSNFDSLSLQALSKSTDHLLKLAEERLKAQTSQHVSELDNKKRLIDQQLEHMTAQLEQVKQLVSNFENQRNEQYGALRNELATLSQVTSSLQQALANNRVRGQWGERIAEDILRAAGFIEGKNYIKQARIEDGKSRPDFTFLLPNGLSLNMDAKFPLENYLQYLKAEADNDKTVYRDNFLRDVKKQIKELCSKDYINPEQNTVDCVLMFIPNEQIYRFIHEEDDGIIDEALRDKVVICSPLTLFIVLAVVRQAVQNFALQASSREILDLLGRFEKEWKAFVKKMDEIEHSLEKAQKAYNELITTRKNALEKPLINIERLKMAYNVEGSDELVIRGET
jgi:DNA recombination protein RmuC